MVRSPIGCTTEDPKPDKFFKWCAKNKVIWDKCTMSMSNTTGRCVVAKQHINKDEVVVEVADDAVLMAENCQIQELLAGQCASSPWASLALCLLLGGVSTLRLSVLLRQLFSSNNLLHWFSCSPRST